jgi:hypothetical protein
MALFIKHLHGNLVEELKEIELDFSSQMEKQFTIVIDEEKSIILNENEISQVLEFFQKFLE